MSAGAARTQSGGHVSLPNVGSLARTGSAAAEDTFTTPSASPTQIAIQRFRENRTAMVALVGFAIICALSFLSPAIIPAWSGRGPNDQNITGTVEIGGKQVEPVDSMGMPGIGPGLRRTYTLGSDALGRDVFARALAGGSVSLRVGFAAMAIVMAFGTLMGMVGGFYGGLVDKTLSYIVDVMMAFPFLLFAIAIATIGAQSGTVFGLKSSSIMIPIGLIGFFGSFGFSRIVRSQAKEVAAGEYVEAARALGAGDGRVIFRHILPQIIPLLVTYSGLLFIGAILGEAGMSFLGVGVQPPTPSWGALIGEGRAMYANAWWIAGAGGLFVVLTALCSNLVAQGLEDAFDPKGVK